MRHCVSVYLMNKSELRNDKIDNILKDYKLKEREKKLTQFLVFR